MGNYGNKRQRNHNSNYNKPVKLDLKLTKESYIDDAEKVIKELKKNNFKEDRDTLTTNQIRKILSLTSKISDQLMTRSVDSVQEDLNALRIQLVYQSGRNKAVKKFVDLAELLPFIKEIQQSNDKQDIQRFCRYIEALVAYFKFYGGSNY